MATTNLENPEHFSSETTSSKIKNGIPFFKPTLTKNELKSVLESLVQDAISTGATVNHYEKEFARAFEFQRALALPSLTAAYHLALLSLEVKAGEEVILPASAPLAALDAIGQIGATPVLLDLARDSFHPEPAEIIQRIGEKTRAIILSYPFGSFKDYEMVREAVAQEKTAKKKIYILEDITYIVGSEYKGHYVGAYADIALVGLHEDGLMTLGKGAMLLTDSNTTYTVAKDLRMHGGSRPYRVRFDYTITDYQAAMGLEQLNLLPSILERRRKIGHSFLEALRHSRLSSYFYARDVDVYAAFPVLFDNTLQHAQRYFQSLGIETRRVFPLGPLHQMLSLSASEFPATERLYQKGLLVPLYPYLTKMNIERLTAALRGFY